MLGPFTGPLEGVLLGCTSEAQSICRCRGGTRLCGRACGFGSGVVNIRLFIVIRDNTAVFTRHARLVFKLKCVFEVVVGANDRLAEIEAWPREK
jgi:hypothetical protein